MNAVSLTLPYPPTVNHLYTNVPGRGRVKSAHYKRWCEEAGWEARRQRAGKVAGPYALYITACRPDARKRDLGNLEKPISDALKTAGVIEDDHLCEKLTMCWGASGDTVFVTVVSTLSSPVIRPDARAA